MMNPKETGILIAQCRKERNWTQKELADILGVTDKAISRWETGKGFPDVAILPSLSRALGLSIAEIVNGERTVPDQTEEQMNRAVLAAFSYSKRMVRTLIATVLTVAGVAFAAAPMYVIGTSTGIFVVLGCALLLAAAALYFVKKAPPVKLSRAIAWVFLLSALAMELIPGSTVLVFATPERRLVEYFSCFDLTPVGYANSAPFLGAVLTAICCGLMMFWKRRKVCNCVFVLTILAALFMVLPPVLFGLIYLTPLNLGILLVLVASAALQAYVNGISEA